MPPQEPPEEYNILEHASRVADELVEYIASELSAEEWERVNNLFESKRKDNKDLRMFNTQLAMVFGLNEAIFLHQLRGILKYDSRAKVIHDYRGSWKGFFNNYKGWLKVLPMLSKSTLERTVARLEKLQILYSKRGPWQKYYGINFKALLYFLDHPEDMKQLLK